MFIDGKALEETKGLAWIQNGRLAETDTLVLLSFLLYWIYKVSLLPHFASTLYIDLFFICFLFLVCWTTLTSSIHLVKETGALK